MAATYTLKAARAVAAVPDAHKTRFVVGSQCLREENQARLPRHDTTQPLPSCVDRARRVRVGSCG